MLRAQGERVVVEPELVDRANAQQQINGERDTARDAARSAASRALGRRHEPKGTSAELAGSPEVAERFAALLKHARPDLEDALARWIGDVPAHALARAAHDAGGWLRARPRRSG